MINKQHRNYFFPTNISPLWTGCYDKNKKADIVPKIIEYLNTIGALNHTGGIPTTMEETIEQWDMPNAWPPLQYIVVMSLDNLGIKDAQAIADKIADRWMETNYRTFLKKKVMYEKYNVNNMGSAGESTGEYKMQEGFGWTNGIILEFLHKYRFTVNSTTWNITSK
uniref:Trehalase n=1 Tax=Schizaphis graminum TaxID=13262 RepID=A0A2S2P7W5_SCHGA